MRLVFLGLRCNNACVFCAQGALRAGGEADRTAEIDAAIGAVVADDIVAFVGGEPTLDERLPALVRAAGERGARRILVQSNGRRLAYRAYARELAAAAASAGATLVLDVSLHGSTEAMHEYHTQAPGSFAQTVLGLRNAREAGIETAVTTVITRSNVRHLVEIVRLAHAASVSAVQLSMAEPYGSAARSAPRVIASVEMARPHVAQAVAEARRLGLGILVPNPGSENDAEVRRRFAGIGDVLEVAEVRPARVGLPLVSALQGGAC